MIVMNLDQALRLRSSAAASSSSMTAANAFFPYFVMSYPITMTQFRTCQYGETNNIAMRMAIPEGTSKIEVLLDSDHQGVVILLKWPVSMREVRHAEGIPEQATQALNRKVLDELQLQNLPLEEGPKCRFTQRFPFPVLPELEKRRRVIQETELADNKKCKTLLLTV